MLVDREKVIDLLVCPKTGRPLQRDGDRLVPEGGDGGSYPIVNGVPVVVDFEESILDRDTTLSLRPAIERRTRSGVIAAVKRIVAPTSPHTERNVAFLMNGLWESLEGKRVLIVGGGTVGQGMQPFYDHAGVELVSFDVYASPVVQFVADAHAMPVPDETFDLVIIQAVMEHVVDPRRVAHEIHRVLKADGVVYAETPFLQHVHEGPYDFTRFTESGHRYLFREFDCLRSGTVSGAGTQLLWALDNFTRGLLRSRLAGRIVRVLFFWLQYLDRVIPEPYNVDAACGVYFLGRKRPHAIAARDLVAHYKGAQRG